MKRRDALKLIAGAAALPAFYSRDVLALGRSIHEQLNPSAALHTLNAHQNATVTAMAEMILPATDTPGATAARVNEFIDLVLTDWCTAEECRRFLDGLAGTDARSRKMFAKDFVECTPQQQTELLTGLDEEVSQLRDFHQLSRGQEDSSDAAENPLQGNFFYVMKRLTLFGYYTSEIGWTQGLGRRPVYMGPYQACVSLPAAAGKTHAS